MAPRTFDKRLVLTPGVSGNDGLSLLSRETIAALGTDSAIEVWSLNDGDDPVGWLGAVRSRPARGSHFRFASWGLLEGLRSQGGRMVLCLHAHLAPVALPLIGRGARLVHVLVGIEVWRPLSGIQRAALHRASPLVAISDFSKTEFQKWNPSFAETRIAVCHPGIPDLGTGEERQSERRYALIVGRMSSAERYKGHDLLLEIWGEVSRRHPGARLVIAGDGDDRSRLEEKAANLGLGDAVQFSGHVLDRDLERLYRECAFFVMPSRKEGFGLVFLEAMRAGKPCIGGTGAASEIIDDGATGFVVECDARAVLGAVDRMWSDDSLRRRMGSLSRNRFSARFTSDHFRRRLAAILDETP